MIRLYLNGILIINYNEKLKFFFSKLNVKLYIINHIDHKSRPKSKKVTALKIFRRCIGNCVHDRRRMYNAAVIMCTIVVYIPFANKETDYGRKRQKGQ